MKSPSLYTLKQIQLMIHDGPQCEISTGQWAPARPIGFHDWRQRIRLAWGVFTGQYDAVRWPGEQ